MERRRGARIDLEARGIYQKRRRGGGWGWAVGRVGGGTEAGRICTLGGGHLAMWIREGMCGLEEHLLDDCVAAGGVRGEGDGGAGYGDRQE